MGVSAGERYPILRTGEREEIPGFLRLAIWYRDGGRCRMCVDGGIGKKLHLDHVLPWSAGGRNDSTNLRMLCERHNMERSNFCYVDDTPQRVVTWWCVNCFSRDLWADWAWVRGIPYACPVDGATGCRVLGFHQRALRVNGVYPDPWHERDPIEFGDTIAFCAHCDAPGLTSVVL